MKKMKACKRCTITNELGGIFTLKSGKLCTECLKKRKKESYHTHKKLTGRKIIIEKKCKICEFVGDKSLFHGKTCLTCHNQSKRIQKKIKTCKQCGVSDKNTKWHGKICVLCFNDNRKVKVSVITYKKCKRCKNKNVYSTTAGYCIDCKKIRSFEEKLKDCISATIIYGLKRSGNSKRKKSCLNYLPYTIQELRICLEKQFEPWMTWDNHGIYNTKKWNDNDPTTWTWQIDHITPHSLFLYTSMESKTFRNCWALSNLRPLSAKQNIIDKDKRRASL